MPEIRLEIDGDPVVFRVQHAALVAAGPGGGHLLEAPPRRDRLDQYTAEELAILWRLRWRRNTA